MGCDEWRLDAERYVPDSQTPEATEDTSLLEMVEIPGPDSSVGRASDTTLRGRGFKSLSGRGFRPLTHKPVVFTISDI